MSPLLETFGFSSVLGWRVPSAGGAGAYELIQTVNGTGSSPTVSFTSIPSIYKHLQVRMLGRSTSFGGQNAGLTFNNVSTSSYAWHLMRGAGSNVISTGTTTTTSISIFGSVMQSSNLANTFGMAIIDIADFNSTAKNKTVRCLSGYQSDDAAVGIGSGLFTSLNAITSIQLTSSVGSFTTTSRFSLYGIKGV